MLRDLISQGYILSFLIPLIMAPNNISDIKETGTTVPNICFNPIKISKRPVFGLWLRLFNSVGASIIKYINPPKIRGAIIKWDMNILMLLSI